MRLRPVLLALSLLVLAAGPAQPQGYTIRDNVIRVETRDHWRGWDIAVGAATVTPEGTVFPSYQRRRVNVAREILEERDTKWPSGVDAGSNPEAAGAIIDGDPTTYWEPDLDARQADWWIRLRLGRVVVVDSIVLRFVDEGQGEPFLQFDVSGWRHPPKLAPSRFYIVGTFIPAFWGIFQTDRPNKTERRFSFVPRTTEQANLEFVGDPLEMIHILVTDSGGDRFRDVSAETYESLLPADARGAVEYYRLSGAGRQTLTTKLAYEQLAPERQGRVRYFQRERPRLAEVEVWTKGDNFNHGQIQRGAINTISTPGNPRGPTNISTSVTDGDPSTGPSVHKSNTLTYIEDLGTLFWIDAVDFLFGGVSRPFYLDISDGDLAPDGSVLWTNVYTDGNSATFRGFGMEPMRVRYLRCRMRGSRFTLAEVMLYGEGYVAEAVLTSHMINLGGRKGLVAIEWDAETPPGTWLEIVSRTGNTLADAFIYHDTDGRIVTEHRYNRELPRVKKGEVIRYDVPGPDFSEWSLPYERSGDEISSPRTRRYLQLQTRIVADTVSKYGPPARLHALRVHMADLYTDDMVGEVWPTRVERIGEPEPRSYYLRPVFGNQDQGFDQVRIATTAATNLDLVDVRVGSRADFLDGAERVIPAAQIRRAPTGLDTLDLQLPQVLRQDVELVQVRMQSTIHANSVAFEGAVRLAADNSAWQIADVGDATLLVDSQTNLVLALADNRVLSELRVEPGLFTPNGDGVNDVTTLHFSVNRVRDAHRGVTVAVYDLGGRLVRQLPRADGDRRGTQALIWDGDDDGGRRVAPGTYVVRLQLQTVSDRAQGTLRTRTVHVAY